jgi:hypothetical protein
MYPFFYTLDFIIGQNKYYFDILSFDYAHFNTPNSNYDSLALHLAKRMNASLSNWVLRPNRVTIISFYLNKEVSP